MDYFNRRYIMPEEKSYPYLEFLKKSASQTLVACNSRAEGLTETEAEARLKQIGSNSIPRARLHWLKVLGRQFASPFIYLLAFAALISFILHERIDATTILVILCVNGFLGFIQEYRAEKSLEKLEQLLVPSVHVRRNGEIRTVRAHDLVPGDVVPLEAGDVIPADVRFIEVQGLVVDETILTGESVSVGKKGEALLEAPPELSSAENVGFSGTKIGEGRAVGIVVATGGATVLGRIAHRLHHIERKSGYEEHLHRFSSLMMRMVVVTIAVLFLANWILKARGGNDLAELFLFVLALAVSVVPEALPVVTTLTLSSSAARLAKEHVVVRRLSALEDLGNIDVLCTDKTGTITENKLTLTEVVAENPTALLHAALQETIWLAKRTPGGIAGTNSFDQALWSYAAGKRVVDNATLAQVPKVAWDLPFDPKLRMTAVVVESDGTLTPTPLPEGEGARVRERTLIVRGAPEEMLTRSTLSAVAQKNTREALADAGKRGQRTLGVGMRTVKAGEMLNVSMIRDLAFLGYVTFEDPLKPTTADALNEARALGVDVRVITGDSAEVAFAVGKQIGLVTRQEEVHTGAELRVLGQMELDAVVEMTKIFARVSPDEKFLIIQSLQKKHSVGFLGEGVNDAPALELANAALVVDSASPVAREAADIILLKRDLRVIAGAIASGRKTFENVGKYLKYTLIGNFGNFYAMAGISLILPFVPLLPAQILLTNLLTDLPLMAVAFDRVDDTEVRAPRSFALRPLLFFAVFLGLISSLDDFLFFGIFRNAAPAELRTMWFVLSILTELALIFSIRTRRFFLRGPAPAFSLTLLAFGAAGIAIALPFMPFAQSTFHFIRPTVTGLKIVALLTLLYFVLTEAVKLILYRFSGSLSSNGAQKARG